MEKAWRLAYALEEWTKDYSLSAIGSCSEDIWATEVGADHAGSPQDAYRQTDCGEAQDGPDTFPRIPERRALSGDGKLDCRCGSFDLGSPCVCQSELGSRARRTFRLHED